MSRLLRVLALFVLGCTQLRGGPETRATVLALNLDGVIHPVVVDILDAAISQADRNGDRLILIRLDTPGGFADATRTLVEKIVASPVPIAVWVGPAGARAASAGFFLLQAANFAAMAPGTNTGAAHPVLLVGQPDPVMMAKIANDSAASLRSVTTLRNRNAQLAESAVLESKSFSDKEALDGNLIDFIANSEADLLRQLQISDPKVREFQLTLSQRVHWALADPNLSLGILLLGALALYAEFTTPGLIFPGVAGAILIILGLSGISVLPLSWTGILLLLVAVALFILEAKITSHGVLGAGGIAAMVLGAVMLVDSPIPELRIRLSTAATLAVPFGILLIFLVTLAIRAKQSRVQVGSETYAGQTAVALTELAPEGEVLFHGDVWHACARAPVHAADHVRICAVHGLQLEVEPISGG